MKTHHLESAIFALAHCVVKETLSTEQALDVLSDAHSYGVDDAQAPLYLNICHDCCTTASVYEFKDVESALTAAIDNINEFKE